MVEEQSRFHVAPVALVVGWSSPASSRPGGLRHSPARMRRQLAVGQSVDTAQVAGAAAGARGQAIAARWPARLAHRRRWSPPQPGSRMLRTATRASSNDIADALTIADPPLPAGCCGRACMLARDRGVLFQLHPRMPERRWRSWKLRAGGRPRAATLVIRGKRFKERDNLIGGGLVRSQAGRRDPARAGRRDGAVGGEGAP